MFGKSQPAAAAPAAPDPVRIPGANDPDVQALTRRKLQEVMGQKQGRQSTLLAPDTSASAPTYSRTTLG